MRLSPVYILCAAWQPSGQPWGIHKVSMWERTRQRLMGKGRCPCDDYIRKWGRGKGRKRRKEISHSALSIVGVRADVKHVHDLQRIGEVITRLVVLGIEDPNRERTSVFTSIAPVHWEDDIKSFCFSLAVTETFLEYLPERWIIWIRAIPRICERWIRVLCIVCGGGRGSTNPVGEVIVSDD